MSLPTFSAAASASHPDRLCLVFKRDVPFRGLPAGVARAARALAEVRKFKARVGETLLLPQPEGKQVPQWLFAGLGAKADLAAPEFCAALAKGLADLTAAGAREISIELPPGLPWSAQQAGRLTTEAALMQSYTFRHYRTRDKAPPNLKLELVHGADAGGLKAGIKEGRIVGEAIALTRDLINQPAAVAHPGYLQEQAEAVARRTRAALKEIRGETLLRQGYEAIHAVGQASEYPPALVALEYGTHNARHPTVVLVGKGVTFDTGGLDLKPSSGMALMKKDMGGAAIVLGAFQAIATLGLPVHLVAVLGLAENAVGSRSYRPGDIVRSKAGLTIEITNTDAEGRVVLADAMALAHTYKPDYLIDFATLTGACRVALGKDLMGLFCDHARLRNAIQASAQATGDAVWPLPLWAGYRKKLESPVADLINAPSDGMAGAITAALFLKEFAGSVAWAHLDCYAWSEGEQPLFPRGGSGVGVRLLVDLMPRLAKA